VKSRQAHSSDGNDSIIRESQCGISITSSPSGHEKGSAEASADPQG
jgi:hypothetical protein